MKKIIPLFAAASVLVLAGCQQNATPTATPGSTNNPVPPMTNAVPPPGEMNTNTAAEMNTNIPAMDTNTPAGTNG